MSGTQDVDNYLYDIITASKVLYVKIFTAFEFRWIGYTSLSQ